MEEAMYQILLQDQLIKQDAALRAKADTSLVYEGIFNELGYNTDDFLRSLHYYLEEPARMEKVMENVAERLEKEAKDIRKQLDLNKWREKLMSYYWLPPDTVSLPRLTNFLDSLPVRIKRGEVQVEIPTAPEDTTQVPLLSEKE